MNTYMCIDDDYGVKTEIVITFSKFKTSIIEQIFNLSLPCNDGSYYGKCEDVIKKIVSIRLF